MKKTNVLMIDDNVELVNMVKEYFSDNEDVSITLTAHDGVEGLKLILERENEYDVILLDLIMPKKDGMHVLKELKEKKKNGPVYPSVAYELGAQISERTGQEIRVTVPGHMQRGGEPCPYDRVIATRLGAEAAEMIRRKEYGYMVALNNNKIEKIPLADIAGKLKMVDPKSDIIREAKDVGISFGDE